MRRETRAPCTKEHIPSSSVTFHTKCTQLPPSTTADSDKKSEDSESAPLGAERNADSTPTTGIAGRKLCGRHGVAGMLREGATGCLRLPAIQCLPHFFLQDMVAVGVALAFRPATDKSDSLKSDFPSASAAAV